MTELRWILLAVGVLVVIYVYWRGRSDQQRARRSIENRIEPTVRSGDLDLDARPDERREPVLGDVDAPALSDTIAAAPLRQPVPEPVPAAARAAAPSRPAPVRAQPSRSSASEKAVEAPPNKPANKIVALRIAKREGARIPGPALLEALEREGLEFGEYKIFHRYTPTSADGRARAAIFSVANMVEPGELDPDRAGELETPGVAVFMILPGAKSGLQALTDMLSTARRVATALDAELLDQNGSTMTRQTADHLRDEVIEFEHRHRGEQASAPDR
jgi:cell division protein ZipA